MRPNWEVTGVGVGFSLEHSLRQRIPTESTSFINSLQRAEEWFVRSMEGYTKVAQLMAAHDEFAILRSFKALSMQNLLYLQAELIHLESQLRDLARRDATRGDRPHHTHDWWSLSQSEEEEGVEQWEKFLEIREKIDKYTESILKHAALSQLGRPTHHDLQFLRSWFERPSMGSFPLLGLDKKAWEAEHESDLVALNARKASDRLTRWFTDTVIPRFHVLLGERLKVRVLHYMYGRARITKNGQHPVVADFGNGIYKYEESTLQTTVYIITTVIASLLPLCSVVVLFLIDGDALRMGVIVILSACFSIALILTTNARQIEVFAATSA
ncbi:hypothetical protein NA57DRAFT_75374 [Rhizodiscina lignyota]|uniref:DUF6594 domain-containing protein n=1 Tax=Rhizodiscina lignyota TaxID=1504668 RepID=A0A9P4IF96_9PEZI|nr:hypothetical protein NA57DRAFT_75374 [Rhizodiscina lignyota]